jgi:hypothetical protein
MGLGWRNYILFDKLLVGLKNKFGKVIEKGDRGNSMIVPPADPSHFSPTLIQCFQHIIRQRSLLKINQI